MEMFRKQVFQAVSPQRCWKKQNWHSHAARGAQNKTLPTEHGDHISVFYNPSSARTLQIIHKIEAHHCRNWSSWTAEIAISPWRGCKNEKRYKHMTTCRNDVISKCVKNHWWEHWFRGDNPPTTKQPGCRLMVFQQPHKESRETTIPTAKKPGGHADDCQQ